MTHREGFLRLSARSAWRGDAGHRKPRGTPSESPGPQDLGKPPFRSRGRTAGGRRKALPMSRIACGFPPTRRVACAISMGHYQRDLVYGHAQRRDLHSPGDALGEGPRDRRAGSQGSARSLPPVVLDIWGQYIVFVIRDYRRHGFRAPPATQHPGLERGQETVYCAQIANPFVIG